MGGNGGATPRHADLVAQDLSDAELVRLTDRFLMFHIRTADRLERTSTWLDDDGVFRSGLRGPRGLSGTPHTASGRKGPGDRPLPAIGPSGRTLDP